MVADERSDAQKEADALAEAEAKRDETKQRTPTKYHALVLDEKTGGLRPLRRGKTPTSPMREFEGSRDAILEEVLTTEEYGVEVTEETGKSEWLYIVPVRGFVRIRGTVETKRSVVSEQE